MNVNPNKTYINGPVNVIRMEGSIENIQKTVYIFMDEHVPIQEQTQCEDIYSKDIQQFLVNEFGKLENNESKFDFFLEIFPEELETTTVDHQRDIYIEEVVKMFKKVFRYNKQKNRVYESSFFSNIRFHYLDIRDIFDDVFTNQFHSIDILLKSFKKTKDPKILFSIMTLFVYIKNKIQDIIVQIKSSDKVDKQIIIEQNRNKYNPDKIKYIVNKLNSSYKHKSIKKKIGQLLNQSIKEFEQLKLRTDKITNILNHQAMSTITDIVVDTIIDAIEQLNDDIVDAFAKFTDIFFLRRFLDKDYITKAIVYCGTAHAVSYIFYLHNEYHFKITTLAKGDIQHINKLIKKNKFEDTVNVLNYDHIQCVNFTDFPNYFK